MKRNSQVLKCVLVSVALLSLAACKDDNKKAAPAAPAKPAEQQTKPAVVQAPDTKKPEAPKPEGPKPEVPKPEGPKPEVPKPEVPKPEGPKPEGPKPEAPKPEAPKPEQPQQPDAPKPDAPKPAESLLLKDIKSGGSIIVTGDISPVVGNSAMYLAEKRILDKTQIKAIPDSVVRCTVGTGKLKKKQAKETLVKGFILSVKIAKAAESDSKPGAVTEKRVQLISEKEQLPIECWKTAAEEFSTDDLKSAFEGFLEFAVRAEAVEAPAPEAPAPDAPNPDTM